MSLSNIERFIEPSNRMYDMALVEIKKGIKQSHWMWYIFPQIKGLGKTSTSEFYGIQDIEEAQVYLEHPILGKRLIEISSTLLLVKFKTVYEIFGSPDYLKLKSCMTLFSIAEPEEFIFQEEIDKDFMGFYDGLTRIKLNQ